MKRVELLKNPLKAARVVDSYMGCIRCKYRAKCDNTPASEFPKHETLCEKIWLDAFRDGTEDLESKSTEQMAVFFSNVFRCNCCPVVECEFNTIKHDHIDGCCENPDTLYWWLNEEVSTCQESRHVGLERASKNPVDHPNHYQLMGGVEVIDIIDHILSRADLTPPQDFCLGNVIKYILRADLKNGVEDYKKAAVYLDWLIRSCWRRKHNAV